MVEVGDDVSECISDESIVMINHQTTADVPVLMSLVSHANKGTLAYHVDYIMDVMFRFFPFGWVGLMHGDFFIRQVCAAAECQSPAIGRWLIVYLVWSVCLSVCNPSFVSKVSQKLILGM